MLPAAAKGFLYPPCASPGSAFNNAAISGLVPAPSPRALTRNGAKADAMPPVTSPFETAPIRAELARETPGVRLLEPGYLEAVAIL